jgi:hypothetical protein
VSALLLSRESDGERVTATPGCCESEQAIFYG